jgi:protein SCO1/2
MKTTHLLLRLSAAGLAVLQVSCGPAAAPPDASITAPASLAPQPLRPGDAVPDFAFLDQAGQRVTFHSLRPRAVLVTFIFTRCSMLEFCPRMSQKFLETRKALDESSSADAVELLSLTLDPEHDTPEALAEYARAFGARPGSWTFATCPPEVLETLKRQFGVHAAPTGPNGTIEHNLVTVLVDAGGHVRNIWEGNSWQAAEILQALKSNAADV